MIESFCSIWFLYQSFFQSIDAVLSILKLENYFRPNYIEIIITVNYKLLALLDYLFKLKSKNLVKNY